MTAFGKKGWTPDQLEDLSGKNYIITGANSGIGFEAAKILAGKGARVVILCRDGNKGRHAAYKIRDAHKNADVLFRLMDLADLASVGKAAREILQTGRNIDGLIMNAGVMMPPKRQETKDGFEIQMGTNHFGHFALAGQLAPRIEEGGGRFVSVASIAHKYGLKRMRFEDINWNAGYNYMAAYSQSKLANLLFMNELQRRLVAKDSRAMALACHPGYSATNLQFSGPQGLMIPVMAVSNILFAQRAELGAYPSVLCAAGAEVEAGGYYGPAGFQELGGPVRPVEMENFARDMEAARKLWDVSEELTGVKWA